MVPITLLTVKPLSYVHSSNIQSHKLPLNVQKHQEVPCMLPFIIKLSNIAEVTGYMLKISTPGGEYQVEKGKEAGKGQLNGAEYVVDMITTGDRSWHVIRNGKGYMVELVSRNDEEKIYVLKINGKKVTVTAKDRMDLLLAEMGLGNMASRKVNELKSPMPGLVVDIPVSEGDAVKKGDPLLVLEAMKMENILKAPADVTIKKIVAEKGKAVEKNHVLIQFG